MFVEGEIQGVQIRRLSRFEDHRGWLAELFRHDELPEQYHPVMAYVSQTLPGVARGPHEHREQTDLFASGTRAAIRLPAAGARWCVWAFQILRR